VFPRQNGFPTLLLLLLACTPTQIDAPNRVPLVDGVVEPVELPYCLGSPYETSRVMRRGLLCDIMRSTLQAALEPLETPWRGCYARTLVRDRMASGQLTTRFTIGDDGRVAESCVVESEIDDRALIHCIASSFEDLRFPETTPRSSCPVPTLRYAISFSPP